MQQVTIFEPKNKKRIRTDIRHLALAPPRGGYGGRNQVGKRIRRRLKSSRKFGQRLRSICCPECSDPKRTALSRSVGAENQNTCVLPAAFAHFGWLAGMQNASHVRRRITETGESSRHRGGTNFVELLCNNSCCRFGRSILRWEKSLPSSLAECGVAT